MTTKLRNALRMALCALIVTFASLISVSGVEAGPLPQHSGLSKLVGGTGDFPSLVVAVREPEQHRMILYAVEDGNASPLVDLTKVTPEKISILDNSADLRYSPDRKRIAYRVTTTSGKTILGVLDLQSRSITVIAEGRGNLEAGKLSDFERVSSFAWLDAENLLYTKLLSSEVGEPTQGGLWQGQINGKSTLLAEGVFSRVLGVSSDGEQIYLLHFLPGWEHEGFEAFGVLDRASGEIKHVWPSDGAEAKQLYVGFRLVSLPSGDQRIVYATTDLHPGPFTQPPTVWLGDPATLRSQPIWEVTRSEDDVFGTQYYDLPGEFVWSPFSETTFVYAARGRPRGVRRVDFESGDVTDLHPEYVRLLSWQPEGIAAFNVGEGQAILLTEDGVQRDLMQLVQELPRSVEPSTVLVDYEVLHIHRPCWHRSYWPH